MSDTMFRRIICGLLACSAVGCSPTAPEQAARVTDNRSATQHKTQFTLPAALAESSGLACLSSDEFLTINDSGNAAAVHRFNSQAKVTATITIPAANTDWEALSIHQQQLVIADIGNNSGQRSVISLLVMPLNAGRLDPSTLRKFHFSYKKPEAEVRPYQHNLDAEAIASDGEYLWMFSKNWLANESSVYKMSLNDNTSELVTHSTISHVPGVITDAAFSSVERVFVMVGYRNVAKEALAFMFSQNYQPFILLTDQNFRIIKQHDLADAGQVEALCLQNGDIWLSQENSGAAAGRFWFFGTVRELLEP